MSDVPFYMTSGYSLAWLLMVPAAALYALYKVLTKR